MIEIEEDVPLARLDDDRHRRAGAGVRAADDVAELEEALAVGRSARASASPPSASARTCSPPTTGVDALVLRLAGELAEVETRRRRRCAPAAARRTPSASTARGRRASAASSSPARSRAPPGGGVWMNAGAYGSDWSAILVRAHVVTADGAGWLTPAELGLSYRHSELRHGQVVAEVEYRLQPRAAGGDQGDRLGARRAPEGDAAHEQAHVRERLQEPRRTSSGPGRCSRRAGSRAIGSAAR